MNVRNSALNSKGAKTALGLYAEMCIRALMYRPQLCRATVTAMRLAVTYTSNAWLHPLHNHSTFKNASSESGANSMNDWKISA